MKTIPYQQALSRIAAYCSRGERCKQDIRKKLSAWELTDADIEKIIRYLEKEKFLDEHRYANAFVNDKSKYSHWGVNKIKYSLKTKGIPDTIINESLGTINNSENRERLKQLIDNKKKTIKGADEYEIKNKLIRFALGRGYSYDEITKAMNEK